MTQQISRKSANNEIVTLLHDIYQVDPRFGKEVLRIRNILLKRNPNLRGDIAETAALTNAMMSREEEDVEPVYVVMHALNGLMSQSQIKAYPKAPRTSRPAARKQSIH